MCVCVCVCVCVCMCACVRAYVHVCMWCVCGVSVSLVYLITCTIHSFLCRYLNMMSVVYIFPPPPSRPSTMPRPSCARSRSTSSSCRRAWRRSRTARRRCRSNWLPPRPRLPCGRESLREKPNPGLRNWKRQSEYRKYSKMA